MSIVPECRLVAINLCKCISSLWFSRRSSIILIELHTEPFLPCGSLFSAYTCKLIEGGDVPGLSSQSSPHQRRTNRPLSAVFQNIHPPNIWRHRKGTLSFTQVHLQDGLSSRSGNIQITTDSGAMCFQVNVKEFPAFSYSCVMQVTISEEGSISGSLHRSKKSKKSWKRLWFLLKDKVLYTYRAQEVRGNVHIPLT